LESGEAREVHHHCVLLGFGVDAICPYLAFDILESIIKPKANIPSQTLLANYRRAVGKGIRKVMAKMGISTLQSYKGAQIFEAVGVGDEVVERCFTGVSSRINGVTFSILEKEAREKHIHAYHTLSNGIIRIITPYSLFSHSD